MARFVSSFVGPCRRWALPLSLGVLALCASPRPAAARRTAAPLLGLINVNEASREQLVLLPGIGPTRADAILRYRQRHRFGWVGQLRRVRGIGKHTLRLLRPYLRLQGPTTLQRAPRADIMVAAAVPQSPPAAPTPAPTERDAATTDADPVVAGVDPPDLSLPAAEADPSEDGPLFTDTGDASGAPSGHPYTALPPSLRTVLELPFPLP